MLVSNPNLVHYVPKAASKGRRVSRFQLVVFSSTGITVHSEAFEGSTNDECTAALLENRTSIALKITGKLFSMV